MAATIEQTRPTQREPTQRRRIALYSVAAIFVALIGLIFVFVWIVLMALQWGPNASPTVFYRPPWMLPIIAGVVVVILLGLHWREVTSAERDRRLRLAESQPELLALE